MFNQIKLKTCVLEAGISGGRAFGRVLSDGSDHVYDTSAGSSVAVRIHRFGHDIISRYIGHQASCFIINLILISSNEFCLTERVFGVCWNRARLRSYIRIKKWEIIKSIIVVGNISCSYYAGRHTANNLI